MVELPLGRPPGARSLSGERKPRQQAGEIKRRVLDMARELVTEQGGLTVSLNHLSLEYVIAQANVPRSSVYRLWEKKEHFVSDLLTELAGSGWRGTAAMSVEVRKAATEVVLNNMDYLTSESQRFKLMHEAVRVATQVSYEQLLSSVEWRTYVAMAAAMLSLEDANIEERVLVTLQESEGAYVAEMAGFYTDVARVLGFQLKEPYTYEDLATSAAAFVEGLALRQVLSPGLTSRLFDLGETGLNSPNNSWPMASIGMLGLITVMVEIDPSYVPPPPDEAGRRRWLMKQHPGAVASPSR